MKPNYWYDSGIWHTSNMKVKKWHLDALKPALFFVINNITIILQKGSRYYGWLTSEDKSCTNSSITLFNVDNSILDTEGSVFGTIVITLIEITFDN